MSKLIGVKTWSSEVMTLTLLAGCATTTPSMAPWNSGGTIRHQNTGVQQATMSGDRDKARDKDQDKEKDKDKPDKGQQRDKQPCPPGQKMSSATKTFAHQPCPPGQQSAMADQGQALAMGKDKDKDRKKEPDKDKRDRAY